MKFDNQSIIKMSKSIKFNRLFKFVSNEITFKLFTADIVSAILNCM